VISDIGINVEERNIWEKEQWREEILAAQGKDTVPILCRDATNGNIHWLPESDAIVRYLLQNYGEKVSALGR
jgi:glutathione S-transferase